MCYKKIRILLVSVGGLTGTYLVKHLSRFEEYDLVGCDLKERVVLQEKLVAYYQVPPVTDEKYCEVICEIIDKERIDVIIPITSYDMLIYGKEPLYSLYKDRMLIMPYEWCILYHDKELCSNQLELLNIRNPKIMDESNLRYPAMLKGKKSSGSKKTIKIERYADYVYWKDKFGECILTEYIEGSEYTVDCLFNKMGICIGYNVRKRIAVIGGGATVCQNVDAGPVESTIKKLETTGQLRGAVNFQFKYVDGEICIFDVNPRFPSGGLPLTVESGFDIPRLMIQLILGEQVNKWIANNKSCGKMMYRYYDEVFYD